MHGNTLNHLLLAFLPLMMLAAGAQAQLTVGDEIVVSAQDFDEQYAAGAYNSVRNEFMVVWHDDSGLQSRSIMGRRYTATGSFIAEYLLVFEETRDNAQPDIAYDPVNDRYLLTYVHDVFGDGSDFDIYGRWIPFDGPNPSLTPFPICTFPSKQLNPHVAYAGTEQAFMVTWWNGHTDTTASYISAKYVSPTGIVNPSAAIAVAFGPEERMVPDIAYNQARNEYLIVFQLLDAGGGDVYGVRLTASGSIIGTGEFGIATWPDPETAPRVAASRSADEWAVAWQSDVPGMLKDIFARRLWVDGGGSVVTEAPVHVYGLAGNESYPDIGVYQENSTYLITWEQQYSSVTGPYGISARTLDSMNSMGPAVAVRTPRVDESIECSRPAVAAGASSWFVAWEHERDPVPNYVDIHGAVVSEPIFIDDFESGLTNRWSSVTP